MIDTEKMRKMVGSHRMIMVSAKYDTHDDECKYYHWNCAIIALCNELDQLRVMIAEAKAFLKPLLEDDSDDDLLSVDVDEIIKLKGAWADRDDLDEIWPIDATYTSGTGGGDERE